MVSILDVEQALKAAFQIIVCQLNADDTVDVGNLGSFSVSQRAALAGRKQPSDRQGEDQDCGKECGQV